MSKEPLDDLELLSISQISRSDESGIHLLSVNLVQHELRGMVEAQRISRMDEQVAPCDVSDPTVQEAYMMSRDNHSLALHGLPIDIKKLKDDELRALILNASKELKVRKDDGLRHKESLGVKGRTRSSSSPKFVQIDKCRVQEGSSWDFHNFEVDDPEVRSYSSKDTSRQRQEDRSGAAAPVRFSSNSHDEMRYAFVPVSPATSALSNSKKKPKPVQPIKLQSVVGNVEATLPRCPSIDLVLSPRSAFDDCSVSSSLSNSTSGGHFFHYKASSL